MSDEEKSLTIREKIVIKLCQYIFKMLDVEGYTDRDWFKEWHKEFNKHI